MPKHFNTIIRYLSVEEKRERAQDYNEFEVDQVDIDEFVKKDIFDETIILKCLNCDFQEEVDYEFVSECWDESDSMYPVSYCPKCNKPKVVPIDVYNRINHIK